MRRHCKSLIVSLRHHDSTVSLEGFRADYPGTDVNYEVDESTGALWVRCWGSDRKAIETTFAQGTWVRAEASNE